MPKDKNSKNNSLEKLRKILDNKFSHKDFQSDNEKYLVTLDKRLKKKSNEDISYRKTISQESEQKDIDSMKPKVIIHVREKKDLEIKKVKEPEPKVEILTIVKEEKPISEDVFEIEKVEVIKPRFVEVKPKAIIKETKEPLLEKKVEIPEEELTEWEPVEKKEEKKLKEIKKKAAKLEPEFEDKIEKKNTLEITNHFCTYCNAQVDKSNTFCPTCGQKLNDEIEEEKIKVVPPEPEPVPAFIRVKKTEKDDSLDWEPVEIEKPKVKIKAEEEKVQIIPEELGVARETKIEAFKGIENINEETAILLYNNGFTNIESLKKATVKDLTKIKGIKRRTAKKIKKELERIPEPKPIEVEEKQIEILEEQPPKRKLPGRKKIKQKKTEDESFTEYFIEEESKKDEANHIDEKIKEYEPLPTTEEEIFKEEVKEYITIPSTEEANDAFKNVNSIDDKIANLLKENGINTIDALRKATIKDLTAIKGIKRKVAKKIKKEVGEFVEKSEVSSEEITYNLEEKRSTKEEDEWESYEEDKISDETQIIEFKGFRHGDFTLYEKSIETKDGKIRKIRFFSKAEPEGAEPIELPEGYEVKENPKTGLPYLKKKK